jgi:hypothetical protein
MTIRTAQLAIALALASPMVIATSHQLLAGCTQNGGAGCFKRGTAAHTVRKYYNYAPRAKQSRHSLEAVRRIDIRVRQLTRQNRGSI